MIVALLDKILGEKAYACIVPMQEETFTFEEIFEEIIFYP